MVIVYQGSVRDLSAPKDLDDDLDDEMGIYLVCPMREPFGQPRYGHFRDDFRGEGNQQEGRQAQRGGGHGLRSPARGITPIRDAIFLRFAFFLFLVCFYARPSAVVLQWFSSNFLGKPYSLLYTRRSCPRAGEHAIYCLHILP